MNEPATTPGRMKRMRRRASIVLMRLYSRFFLRAGLHLLLRAKSAAPGPMADGIRLRFRAWLLRAVRRRRMPATKRHPVADSPPPREQQSRPGQDASRHTVVPNEANLAPCPLQVINPTPEPKPSPEVPPPPAIQPQPPPRQRFGRFKALRLANFARNLSPWESEKPATVRRPAGGIAIDLRRIAKPAHQRRIVVIGDCENDTDSVEASLRFVGLISKQGKLKAKAHGAHIVQTGDLMHKNAPNPVVVRYWQRLRTAAVAADCPLHTVAGNHEIEIWRRLQSGDHLGLSRCEQRAVQELIRTTRLFHVEGSMLFIHGYPTVKLLHHLQAYRIGTGKSLNDYNQDCFQEAFDDARILARYAYPRRNACQGTLLHDVPDPARYYRRHGQEVAALLRSFNIDLVVHGHRPERSGVQTDYELQRWLPGIRMINNDTQIRLQGLGATVIRQVGNGSTDLLFVNRNNATPAHRAVVRRVLRSPDRLAGDRPGPKIPGLDAHASRFAHSKDSMDSGFVAVR